MMWEEVKRTKKEVSLLVGVQPKACKVWLSLRNQERGAFYKP